VGILQELSDDQGYLKAGFLGFQKSGKTFTATCLALATHKHFGCKGRVVFFDTEGGSTYVKKMITRYTGRIPLGVRSRAFADLMAVAKELKPDDVLIADSMTHVWRELCDAHLAAVNRANEARAQRIGKKFYPKQKLEFQDYNVLKQNWSQWTDFYLNSPNHIVICGRAGYEYDMEQNEETGKKELVKTGIKMKTEGEFGFEPSLLIEMERETVLGDKTTMIRRATVIGDRFNVLDGKQFTFGSADDRGRPLTEEQIIERVFESFKAHIELLTPGSMATIDTALKTNTGVTEDGDTEWQRERRQRTILLEEIQGLMVSVYPGQSAADKKAKADLMQEVFETRSWSNIESMSHDQLVVGLENMRTVLAAKKVEKEQPRDAA
jgi:hypothetical protein